MARLRSLIRPNQLVLELKLIVVPIIRLPAVITLTIHPRQQSTHNYYPQTIIYLYGVSRQSICNNNNSANCEGVQVGAGVATECCLHKGTAVSPDLVPCAVGIWLTYPARTYHPI